jgi:C-5 cytosine-specific DNA methylase
VTGGRLPAPAPGPPRIGSLCTGYGGLDLAAESSPRWAPRLVRRTDPRASTGLTARFPGVPNLGDIRDVDWCQVEPVDVLTAGFPCQDISNAGKRAGITAWKLSAAAAELATKAGRRGLWVHMGRVNSHRRLRHADAIGCHSADGTYFAYGPDKNLPKLLGWLTTADANTTLEQQHTESAAAKYPTPPPEQDTSR